MKVFLFILSIFSFLSLRAEVLKFDVSGYDRKLFSYKEVCQKMGVKHLLIIDVLDPLRLDCMGQTVSIKDFCLNHAGKIEGRSFLRGYVNSKLSEVACEYGEKAFVSIGCDKRDKRFCKKPRVGCEKLGKIYAHDLPLDHHAFIPKDVDNVVNCYFTSPPEVKQVKADEILLPFQEEPVIDKDIFSFDKTQKKFKTEDIINKYR